MTTSLVVLHSAFGLTRGVQTVIDALEPSGLRILAPDYYRGRVFTTEAQGVGYRDSLGYDTLLDRVRHDIDGIEEGASFLGFSLGASFAQRLIAERPKMGHLILAGHVKAPKGPWPGIPVQIHRFETDKWIRPGDVEELGDAVQISGATFEDHVTPGTGHLVTERHLPEYDPAGVEALVARVHDFLDWA